MDMCRQMEEPVHVERTKFTVNDRNCSGFNILKPNDIQKRHAVSPLKIKISSKNMRENQQIH